VRGSYGRLRTAQPNPVNGIEKISTRRAGAGGHQLMHRIEDAAADCV
jgi:hypothetical protein